MSLFLLYRLRLKVPIHLTGRENIIVCAGEPVYSVTEGTRVCNEPFQAKPLGLYARLNEEQWNRVSDDFTRPEHLEDAIDKLHSLSVFNPSIVGHDPLAI